MYRIMIKEKLVSGMKSLKRVCTNYLFHKSYGIDGILVTVGLCIIALVLCVVMKDALAGLITNIVKSMTTKAEGILQLNK